MLKCVWEGRFRHAAVPDQGIGGDRKPSWRRDGARAPIAKAVAIHGERHRGGRDQGIGPDQVRGPAVVHIEIQEHRCRLQKLICQFIAKSYQHAAHRSFLKSRDYATAELASESAARRSKCRAGPTERRAWSTQEPLAERVWEYPAGERSQPPHRVVDRVRAHAPPPYPPASTF